MGLKSLLIKIKTMAAKKTKSPSKKEEVIPEISVRTDAKHAVVTVILDNNKSKKEQRSVKLVVVNGELVPDHNDTNPGVFSAK